MCRSRIPLAERPLLPRLECQQHGAHNCHAYNRPAPNGFPLVPFLGLTYGRPGKSTVSIHDMLCAAGEVRKSCFVATALRELSVGLCKGNYLMHRVSLGMLTGVAGWGFCTGADPPVEESSMRMPSDDSFAFMACWILLPVHACIL
jgi:hypothetical protein